VTHEHYNPIRVGVLWAGGRTEYLALGCSVHAVTRWEKYGAIISITAYEDIRGVDEWLHTFRISAPDGVHEAHVAVTLGLEKSYKYLLRKRLNGPRGCGKLEKCSLVRNQPAISGWRIS